VKNYVTALNVVFNKNKPPRTNSTSGNSNVPV
jgi:hypothetical protein